MLRKKDSFLAVKNWSLSPFVFNNLYRPLERGFFSSGAVKFHGLRVSLCISMNYIKFVDFCWVVRLQGPAFVASTTLSGAQASGFKAWSNARFGRVFR
jgi:hypothetical protein